MADTFPVITVEVAFGNDPFDASLTWTDISAFVIGSINISRGRQHELGRIETGTASLTLTSTDDRFNPENTSGPYSPDVKPLVPIRIRATDPNDATVYDLFRGYVRKWPQTWTQGGIMSRVPIECVDALGLFSRIPVQDWETAVTADTPEAWWMMDETSGDMLDNTTNNHDLQTIEGTPSRGQTTSAPIFGASNQIDNYIIFDGTDDEMYNVASPAGLRITGDLTIEVWVYLVDVAQSGVVCSMRPTSGGDDRLYEMTIQGGGVGDQLLRAGDERTGVTTGVTLATDTWHYVVATREDTVWKIYVNGVLQTTDPVSGTLTATTQDLGVGDFPGSGNIQMLEGRISELAIYTKALTAGRVLAHYNSRLRFGGGISANTAVDQLTDLAGWPQTLRVDYGTVPTDEHIGDSPLDSDLTTVLRRIAESQDGTVWMEAGGDLAWATRSYRAESKETASATFSDDGADFGYMQLNMQHDDTLIRTLWRVTPVDGLIEEAQDTTAVTSFRHRDETIVDAFIGTSAGTAFQAGALARAQAGLAKTKDAAFRIEEIKINGLGQPTAWQHVLGLDIHARINVERTPPGGSVIDKDHYIEHVDHSISKDKRWVTTWRLSPAETQDLWILGDSVMSVLGTSTVLGW